MPSAEQILAGLQRAATGEFALAVSWHVAVGLALASALAGRLPRTRAVLIGLSAPLLSVAIVAWRHDNPFNATIFTALFGALLAQALRARPYPLRIAGRGARIAGFALLLFAWFYPHFLEAPPFAAARLYGSPMGVLPCPTLALVAAALLLTGMPGGRATARTVGAAGAFYGLWGVFKLGVWLDLGLLAGALLLMWMGRTARPGVGAEPAPRTERDAGAASPPYVRRGHDP